jgi:radical SAM protein with 4Fe4S-binding SPASM domain
MPITCINLALSNRCNATCIWCPTSRGTKHNFDMPFDTVKKIIDEVSNKDFPYQIKMLHLSENGEALYNKDFLEIVRYIKLKLPNTAINLLSNFGLMSPKISKVLLKEKLLSSIQVNIDGHDSKTYKAVKGISYLGVIKNLKRFLNLRAEFDPKFNISINVMPAFEYAVTVNAFLRTEPDQYKDPIPFSTYEHTLTSLRKFVPGDIYIKRSKPGLWAERKLITSGRATINIDQSTLDCPLLSRVENEVFIAPNGDLYPCCNDDNNDVVLGNVNNNTLLEIHDSDTRKLFIQRLKAHKYEEIGYPCNTVLCCQVVSIKKEQLDGITDTYKLGDAISIVKDRIIPIKPLYEHKH